MQARIQARIARFGLGNLGDVKSLGKELYEARMMFGPGYRLYFGKEGKRVILLLCGGSKQTQAKDIRRANRYWKGYKAREI